MATRRLATIGYEATSLAAFLSTLVDAGVELLVDVRAVASSRRPGFSKTALAANLAENGIEYLQLRALGTPADGRAAARAGRYDELRRIYTEHLASDDAQAQLETLVGIVRSGRFACLLCYEARPEHCHRTIVAEAVTSHLSVQLVHLAPGRDEE